MTHNEKEIARIMQFTERELLVYLLISPEFLTDSYYSMFRTAIIARATQLGVY